MVNLLGIWKPDDEIFNAGYKYSKPGQVSVEAQFDNTGNFFQLLAPLTEKQIRNSNRLRLPKGMRLDLQLRKLE